MVTFFLLANVYAALFFALYVWLLRGRTGHSWSRFFLLGGVLCSLLLPLVKFDLAFAANPAMANVVSLLPEISVSASGKQTLAKTGNWLLVVYLLVCAAQLARYLHKLWAIKKFVRQQQYLRRENYWLATDTLAGPASFGNKMFFPGKVVDAAILRHELVHIERKHYIDKLLMRLVLCFCYPVITLVLIKRELDMIHEFEADAHAVSDPEQYAQLLLNQHFNTRQFDFLPSFFHHPLKRRIIMLQKTNAPTGYGRRLLVGMSMLIIVAAILFQSNMELNAQQKRRLYEQEINSEAPDTTVFRTSDIMPDYPGGQDALMKFLSDHIVYPEKAKRDSIEGRLASTFVIDSDGTLTDIAISKGLSPECDAEVMRILKLMPKWKPGIQDGKPVRVAYTLPVSFRLKKSNKNPIDK